MMVGSNLLQTMFIVIGTLVLYMWTIYIKLNDTDREKHNSVQEFVEIKSWLLQISWTCLHNQLKFNYKVL